MSLKKYFALSLLTLTSPLFGPSSIHAMTEVETAEGIVELLESEKEQPILSWEALLPKAKEVLISAAYCRSVFSHDDTLVRIDLIINRKHLPNLGEATIETFFTFIKTVCESAEVTGIAAKVRAQLKVIHDLNLEHQRAMGIDPFGNGESRSTVGHGWREKIKPIKEQLDKAHEEKDILEEGLNKALHTALALAFATSPVPIEVVVEENADTVDQEEENL